MVPVLSGRLIDVATAAGDDRAPADTGRRPLIANDAGGVALRCYGRGFFHHAPRRCLWSDVGHVTGRADDGGMVETRRFTGEGSGFLEDESRMRI